MCHWAIASTNDLEEGMSIRGFPLEFNGKSGEKNDLYSGSGGIPERPINRRAYKSAVWPYQGLDMKLTQRRRNCKQQPTIATVSPPKSKTIPLQMRPDQTSQCGRLLRTLRMSATRCCSVSGRTSSTSFRSFTHY
jgi:hypothetical protein